MEQYAFYGKVQEVKEEMYGTPVVGVMELYIEGQTQPIHRMPFNNWIHGLPLQVVDFTFQDYVLNSDGKFDEIADPNVRLSLRTYKKEKKDKTIPEDKTWGFLPAPKANETRLEYVLAGQEYRKAWETIFK